MYLGSLLVRERRGEEERDRAEEGTGGRGKRDRGGRGKDRGGQRRGGEGPHDPLAWGPQCLNPALQRPGLDCQGRGQGQGLWTKLVSRTEQELQMSTQQQGPR